MKHLAKKLHLKIFEEKCDSCKKQTNLRTRSLDLSGHFIFIVYILLGIFSAIFEVQSRWNQILLLFRLTNGKIYLEIQEVKEAGTESELVLLCTAVMWYDTAKNRPQEKETELLLIVITCAAHVRTNTVILWRKIQLKF